MDVRRMHTGNTGDEVTSQPSEVWGLNVRRCRRSVRPREERYCIV